MAIDIVYGEGQTAIDEDEKEALIPFWITNNGQLNRLEQENINTAIRTFYQRVLPIQKDKERKITFSYFSYKVR